VARRKDKKSWCRAGVRIAFFSVQNNCPHHKADTGILMTMPGFIELMLAVPGDTGKYVRLLHFAQDLAGIFPLA